MTTKFSGYRTPNPPHFVQPICNVCKIILYSARISFKRSPISVIKVFRRDVFRFGVPEEGERRTMSFLELLKFSPLRDVPRDPGGLRARGAARGYGLGAAAEGRG